MTHLAKGSEFDIIARHFGPLAAGDAGALNLADDAAVLDVPPEFQLLVTTDALVSGVHFLATQSPQDIAFKVVGVNLSDLAAMGAKPRAVFLAAQFTQDIDEAWLAAFAEGLGQALAPSGAVLMGGDTVSSPGPLALTLTALGFAKTGSLLTRAGANVGDFVYVSGTIGDGALGLLCETGALPADAYLSVRYARPQPRFVLGQALAERGLASACIDVSDGLVADLGHVCKASNVGMDIRAQDVPLSPSAQACVGQNADLLETVLCGGDDYELAFTAPPENAAAVADLSALLDLPLTRVGVVKEPGEGVRVFSGAGDILRLGAGGYRHI